MKRASSLAPALWICLLPTSSRALQVIGSRPHPAIRTALALTHRVNSQRQGSFPSIIRSMSSESVDNKRTLRKRVDKESTSKNAVDPPKKKKKKNTKSANVKDTLELLDNDPVEGESTSDVVAKKERTKRNKVTDDNDIERKISQPEQETAKKTRKTAITHQVLTERDELPKLWKPEANDDSSHTFKICSWNVAGLRAVMRNHPEALEKLVKEHDIDVLCLQETKLQEIHLDDVKQPIRSTLLQPDYDAYYSCSTIKKGYSGTAVFVKRRGKNARLKTTLDNFFAPKQKANNEDCNQADAVTDIIANLLPVNVSYKMGFDDHDHEGRLIKVEFPLFTLINCYIPNSGQKLERLEYRTERWDKDFIQFVQNEPKPTIWLGDLNVAHTNLEVWNDGAKHLATQAGVTQQERDSFQHQLDSSGFRDAFRFLHPTAKGCYSYWSQRAGNREPNKGLRLDYFCCAPNFFHESSNVLVRDSYMLYDVFGSDHCPIVLELEIKN